MESNQFAVVVLQGLVRQSAVDGAISRAVELGFEDAFLVETNPHPPANPATKPTTAASETPVPLVHDDPAVTSCRVATKVYTRAGTVERLNPQDLIARRMAGDVNLSASTPSPPCGQLDAWPTIAISTALPAHPTATAPRERRAYTAPGAFIPDTTSLSPRSPPPPPRPTRPSNADVRMRIVTWYVKCVACVLWLDYLGERAADRQWFGLPTARWLGLRRWLAKVSRIVQALAKLNVGPKR